MRIAHENKGERWLAYTSTGSRSGVSNLGRGVTVEAEMVAAQAIVSLRVLGIQGQRLLKCLHSPSGVILPLVYLEK